MMSAPDCRSAALPEPFVKAVCAEAESWAGTPLIWQQAAKGRGCDCKGFIWGVARELGLPEAESSYARMASYSQRVDVRLLREGLLSLFDLVSAPRGAARQPCRAEPGDVVLLRVRGSANHLGLLTAPGRVMLAQLAPVNAVAAASLAALANRYDIAAVWRWKMSTAQHWMRRQSEELSNAA